MATSNDLFRLDAVLPDVARALHRAAGEQFTKGKWAEVALDIRFARGGGEFSHKIRVRMSNGELASASTPTDLALLLINLDAVRQACSDLWYGLVLRVTAAGECETKFNYDPACAEDKSFYAD